MWGSVAAPLLLFVPLEWRSCAAASAAVAELEGNASLVGSVLEEPLLSVVQVFLQPHLSVESQIKERKHMSDDPPPTIAPQKLGANVALDMLSPPDELSEAAQAVDPRDARGLVGLAQAAVDLHTAEESDARQDSLLEIPVYVSRRRQSRKKRRASQVKARPVQPKHRRGERPSPLSPQVVQPQPLPPLEGNAGAGVGGDTNAESLDKTGLRGRERLAILGICVGVPMLSVLMVLCTISTTQRHTRYVARARAVESAVDETEEAQTTSERAARPPPQCQRPLSNPGVLQRWIFGAEMNESFAIAADAALRASLVVALCALCFWIPSLLYITEQGWSMQYAVTVFCFTFSMHVGSCMMYNWYTLVGTLAAIINTLFMFAIFPDGVTEGNTATALPFAWADFVLFSIFAVGTAWPMLMRMFAMYLQAYFTMSFINPTSTVHFAHSLKDIAMKDGLIAPLVGTIVGCTLTLLASLFPRPLSALGNAQDLAFEVSWSLGQQWQRMTAHITSSGEADQEVVESFHGETAQLCGRLNRLQKCISMSWWECFDLGCPGRVRANLFRLAETFGHLLDWMHGVVAALEREKRAGSKPEHLRLLSPCRDELQQLSSCAWVVLNRVTQLAVSSEMAPEDEATLQEELRALEACRADFLAAFAKASVASYGPDRHLPLDALADHSFIFALNSYAQSVTEYARFLIEDTTVTGVWRAANKSQQPRGAPVLFWQRSDDGMSLAEAMRKSLHNWTNRSVICSWNHIRSSARLLMSYVLAFYLGRLGIPGILPNYTSTPAGVTVFLFNFDGLGGSTFLKKFTRFQGVAVGILLGQLIFAILVRCNFWGAASGFVAVVAFEYFAFYFYYTSTSFWYTSLLIAVFGASQFLSGCGGLSDSPWEVYQALLDQVMAILCHIMADVLLPPPSPSTLAVQAYSEAALISNTAMRGLLQEDAAAGQQMVLHRDELFAKLNLAVEKGAEASLEPRFTRTPWRGELWKTLISHCVTLARKLIIMEFVTAKYVIMRQAEREEPEVRNTSPVPRRQWALPFLRAPAFQRAAVSFLKRREEVLSLAQDLLLHDVEAPLMNKRREDLQRMLHWSRARELVDVAEILEDAGSTAGPEPAGIALDGLGEAGIFLLMLELSTEDLDAITEAIFQAPEVSLDAIRYAEINPPKAGLLREVSGRLEEAVQKSKDSFGSLSGLFSSSNGQFTLGLSPPAQPRGVTQRIPEPPGARLRKTSEI